MGPDNRGWVGSGGQDKVHIQNKQQERKRHVSGEPNGTGEIKITRLKNKTVYPDV